MAPEAVLAFPAPAGLTRNLKRLIAAPTTLALAHRPPSTTMLMTPRRRPSIAPGTAW
jgi:hypothetical protein